MRYAFIPMLLCLFLPTLARADDGDDTLKFYLGKSDVVLVGTVLESPVAYTFESGVPNYACSVNVEEVLKGDAALKGKQSIVVVRFESDASDRTVKLEKGAKLIFFLSQNDKSLSTVDVWFGVQPYGKWMAQSLARLATPPAK
jgi:hypothetical protein